MIKFCMNLENCKTLFQNVQNSVPDQLRLTFPNVVVYGFYIVQFRIALL